jgi:uncharacterized protein
MLKGIDRLIRPDEFYSNLLRIDYGRYSAQGFRLVMLDIDNTLGTHGSFTADDFAREAVSRVQSAGLLCWLVSNGSGRRIRQYAASLGLPCVPMALKPLSLGLRRACRQAGVQPGQAVLIGDQIMTDIIGGHLAGCRTVLVKPLSQRESWNVSLKRHLEKLLLRRYHIE